MLGFIGQTVEGGWNAIGNIVAGVGKGASTFVSGFFPTPQRETIKSETVAAAEGTGMTYRPVLPENLSMGWTRNFEKQDWIGSPYEAQLAPSAKIKEGQDLAAKVSSEDPWTKPWTDAAAQIWKGATGITGAINEQLPNILMAKLGQVIGLQGPPVSDTKKTEENPEGLMQNLQNIIDRSAETTRAFGAGILEQIKGLYNSAFGQTGSQPVFTIAHELDPATQKKLLIAGAVIVAILLFTRGK